MPSCTVITCKNNSRINTLSCGGVSYHRFPQNPLIREKWIHATGRQDWMPSKSSTICSEHFDVNESMDISKKGYRLLKDNAIPTKNILLFVDCNNEEEIPGPSRQQLQVSPQLRNPIKEMYATPSKKICIALDPALILNNSPANPTSLRRQQLQLFKNKIITQNLKIKQLHTQNEELVRKVENMEELLKSLKKKYDIKDVDLQLDKKVLVALKDET